MKISELQSARELLSRKATLAFHKQEHSRRYAEMGIDGSDHLAQYDADIREIETEIVRRAMRYEDRAVTLPQRMLDTVKAGILDISNIGLRTVYELMVERNGLLEERNAAIAKHPDDSANLEAIYANYLVRIDCEIEWRVVVAEERDEQVRRGFMERIQES